MIHPIIFESQFCIFISEFSEKKIILMNIIDDACQLLERSFTPRVTKIFSLVGFLYVASRAVKSASTMIRSLPLPGYDLAQRYGVGSWALIVGIDSLGSALALQLAEKNFSLVLIDADPNLLNLTATKINQKVPEIEIKVIQADFVNSLQNEFFDQIFAQLGELDISVLVNATGISRPVGMFHWNSESEIMNALSCNIIPMTIFTRRLASAMLRRSEKSAIINLSSAAAIYPVPMLGIFSATKAYIDVLSRVLDTEAGSKIDVITVRPWNVKSVVSKKSPLKLFEVSSNTLAKSILRSLGRESSTAGTFRQTFQTFIGKAPIIRDYFTHYFYENEQNSNLSKQENILLI